MNILFLVQNLSDPSARVRVLNLIPELHKYSNISFSYDTFEKEAFKRTIQIVKSRKFDIVFIQRRLIPIWQIILLKVFARKIVFDFDDAIFLRDLDYDPKNKRSWYSFTRHLKFKYFCKFANLVIAGNSYLATEAFKYNKNVKVIPSSVPVNENIAKHFELPENLFPIVGWIGTEGNFKYLKSIEKSLKNIAIKEKFIFRVISSKSYKIEGVNCEL